MFRESILLDLGDLSAPKGSDSWIRAVHVEAKQALNDAATSKEHVQTWVNALQESNHFQRLVDARGHSFFLWEDFCTAAQPFGLGYSPEAIDGIIAERRSIEALAAKAEPMAKVGAPKGNKNAAKVAEVAEQAGPLATRGRAKNNVGNTNIVSRQGTTAPYLTARIARDRPDILDRMKAGEFKSVRAAAKEAGIVREPTPLELLKRDWRRASGNEQIAFLEWVNEQTQDTHPGR